MPSQKRAYSYIRFSSEHQSQGDSLRRQQEATRKYCQEKGLLLDERLDLKDLGVSAFKGKNLETGALGRFIEACKAGQISPGSALVVESLDRISRQSPRRIVGLLTELLDVHRIEVHLTMLGKVFHPDSDDGVDLIIAVAMAMRANEESETKSRRLREVWAKKWDDAKAGKILHPSLPWWLELKNGKIVPIPERASIIKRIFQMAAQGVSPNKIAKTFNAEDVPTGYSDETLWITYRIRKILTHEAPTGVLGSSRKTRTRGIVRKIEGYYPRIVSDELAAEARAVMRRAAASNRGRTTLDARPINLFRGLLKHRDFAMRFSRQKNGPIDPATQERGFNFYYESLPSDVEGLKSWSISANRLESILIHGMLELDAADILRAPVVKDDGKLLALTRKKTDLEEKVVNLVAAVENGSVALAKRLLEVEQELTQVQKELLVAEAQEPSSERAISKDLEQLSIRLDDPQERERTAQALRRLLVSIHAGPSIRELSPMGERLRGSFAKKMLMAQTASIPDPFPPKGKRKEFYVLLTFVGGARRLIAYLPNAKESGVISIRVEPE